MKNVEDDFFGTSLGLEVVKSNARSKEKQTNLSPQGQRPFNLIPKVKNRLIYYPIDVWLG